MVRKPALWFKIQYVVSKLMARLARSRSHESVGVRCKAGLRPTISTGAEPSTA